MRCAIYARYSSDSQREASIEDQVRVCRARAEREGWSVAGIYADYAISGTSASRPRYQQLLADAKAGRFEVILAEALDRISRDQEHIAGFHKQASFAGVRVVTLAEGDISELHVGLKGTMSALFLKDLAQKTHRGLEGRAAPGTRRAASPTGMRWFANSTSGASRYGAAARSSRPRPPSCGASSPCSLTVTARSPSPGC